MLIWHLYLLTYLILKAGMVYAVRGIPNNSAEIWLISLHASPKRHNYQLTDQTNRHDEQRNRRQEEDAKKLVRQRKLSRN